jgi:histone acetyltransferase (RNA polymerase elongator complex component)
VNTNADCQYQGFEQGPIRPPSEAYSLLIRVTRNCPWNRCTFCPVYKGQRFSLRSVQDVKRDIDAVAEHVHALRRTAEETGYITQSQMRMLGQNLGPEQIDAFSAAVHWVSAGMQSIFLQDANSLIIKPQDLIEILTYLKAHFPWVERITSYARSHTVSRIDVADLEKMRQAGLNRVHIGMESGSDRVLERVQKGVTKQRHIEAGVRVKQAGIELSEYIMPGLGGVDLSEEHACETADALNQINPDFIRLRTLRLQPGSILDEEQRAGRFTPCTEVQTVQEIRLLVQKLTGITSTLKSDHMMNLLQDVEGKFPDDKARMLERLESFLALDEGRQSLYFLGRSLGAFGGVSDMDDPQTLAAVRVAYQRLGVTPQNVERVCAELTRGRM